MKKTGLYGHSDHVTLSAIVRELSTSGTAKNTFGVLYATIPRKIEDILKVSHDIRDDVHILKDDYCEVPNIRIPIWKSVWAKYRAALAYKSQKLSQKRPLWMTIAAMPWEYYVMRDAETKRTRN